MANIIKKLAQITPWNRYENAPCRWAEIGTTEGEYFLTEKFCKEAEGKYIRNLSYLKNRKIKVAYGWRLISVKSQDLTESTIVKEFFAMKNPIYRKKLDPKSNDWGSVYQRPWISGRTWGNIISKTPISYNTRVWYIVQTKKGSGYERGEYLAIPIKFLQRRKYRGLNIIPNHIKKLNLQA